MNWKLVLRIYGNLRQLTDDESALLNTLRAMNDTERELLVESLQPQKSTGKKASKSRKSASKSPRAASLSSAIQRTPKTKDDGNDLYDPLCTFVVNQATSEICEASKNDPIHDTTYSSSHEFEPPAQSAAASGD